MTPKLKILVIGHIGKPVGGLSIYYECLLNSSFADKVNYRFLDSMSGTKAFAERGKFNTISILNGVILFIKFTWCIFTFKPDMIDIATAYGNSFLKNSLLIIFAWLLGKKVILRPHCSLKMLIPENKKTVRFYTLIILRLCSGIIVLSKEWIHLSELLPGKRIELLPNAINLDPFLEIERPHRNYITILFLGHIGREKGIYELLDAVELLNSASNNFRLILVGESLQKDEIAEIDEKIKEKKLESLISILPPAYGSEKIQYFIDSDIFVLPSHHEGMPISIIEAMASGLPIVATDVGGIPDLIKNNVSGLLIQAYNSKELADSIYKLLKSTELRRYLGENARLKAKENHEIENYVDDIVDYYQQIISNE